MWSFPLSYNNTMIEQHVFAGFRFYTPFNALGTYNVEMQREREREMRCPPHPTALPCSVRILPRAPESNDANCVLQETRTAGLGGGGSFAIARPATILRRD